MFSQVFYVVEVAGNCNEQGSASACVISHGKIKRLSKRGHQIFISCKLYEYIVSHQRSKYYLRVNKELRTKLTSIYWDVLSNLIVGWRI